MRVTFLVEKVDIPAKAGISHDTAGVSFFSIEDDTPLFIVNPQSDHTTSMPEEIPLIDHLTEGSTEPTFVSSLAHEVISSDRVEIRFESKMSDPLVYQICLNLIADLEGDGTSDGFYAGSMATALSAHLLRHYSIRKHQLQEHEDGLSKYKLAQAIEYINEHLSENKLSLASIAAELKISQYYFCRLFKKSTGMTPHQYLIQQRIKRAKQLLKLPELTVTSIALECGFANQSHLAKYFRLHTGVSPQQFRKI